MRRMTLLFLFSFLLIPFSSMAGEGSEESSKYKELDEIGEAIISPETKEPQIEEGISLEERPVQAIQAPPEEYTVVSGDTLWDICSRFIGNPFYWPILWSINSYIKNPHLIYPGYKIRFGPPAPKEAPTITIVTEKGELVVEEPVEVEKEEEEEKTVELAALPEMKEEAEAKKCEPVIPFIAITGEITVPMEGFIAARNYPTVGKIYKSYSESLNLSDYNIVWIQFDRLSEVKCGDVYSIIKRVKKVWHPQKFLKSYGYLYQVLGEVEIVDIGEYMAVGKLLTVYGELRRGALLTKRIPVSKNVKILDKKKDLRGYVIDTLRQGLKAQVALFDQIFIDKGIEDGVEVGDIFYVVRKGQEFFPPERKDILVPDKVIGRIVISSTDKDWSSGIVIDAGTDVKRGDIIAMKLE